MFLELCTVFSSLHSYYLFACISFLSHILTYFSCLPFFTFLYLSFCSYWNFGNGKEKERQEASNSFVTLDFEDNNVEEESLDETKDGTEVNSSNKPSAYNVRSPFFMETLRTPQLGVLNKESFAKFVAAYQRYKRSGGSKSFAMCLTTEEQEKLEFTVPELSQNSTWMHWSDEDIILAITTVLCPIPFGEELALLKAIKMTGGYVTFENLASFVVAFRQQMRRIPVDQLPGMPEIARALINNISDEVDFGL